MVNSHNLSNVSSLKTRQAALISMLLSQSLTLSGVVAKIIGDDLNFYKKNGLLQDECLLLLCFPSTRIFTQQSLECGGNILGLDSYGGNEIMFLLDMAWNGTHLDVQVRNLANQLHESAGHVLA